MSSYSNRICTHSPPNGPGPGQFREQHRRYIDQYNKELLSRVATPQVIKSVENATRSDFSSQVLFDRLYSIRHTRPMSFIPQGRAWNLAYEDLMSYVILPLGKLNQVKIEDVPTPLETSAGYHYPGKNRNEVREEALPIAKKIYESYQTDDFINYETARRYVLYVRTQLSYDRLNPKVRPVYGADSGLLIAEGVAAAPLLKRVQQVSTENNRYPIVYGCDFNGLYVATSNIDQFYTQDRANLNYVEQNDTPPVYYVEGDWSRWDLFIYIEEATDAFKAISALFDTPNVIRFLNAYGPAFVRPRVVAGPQEFQLFGVLPSGSYFTNIVGSIINFRRWMTIKHRLQLSALNTRIACDDTLLCLKALDYAKFAANAKHELQHVFPGAQFEILNISTSSQDLFFLGHRALATGMSRHHKDVVALAIYVEREDVTDKFMSLKRLKSLNLDVNKSIGTLQAMLALGLSENKHIREEDLKYESFFASKF